MKLNIGRYMIREWRTGDAISLATYANNKNIWANLRDGFPHPYQLSDAENFLSNVARQNPRTIFAIADDKEAIGSIGLMLGEDVQFELEWVSIYTFQCRRMEKFRHNRVIFAGDSAFFAKISVV